LKNYFLIIALFFNTHLTALLVGDGFVQQDIKILEEFDLKSSYFADYKFQEYFQRYKKYHQKSYKKKIQKADLFIPTIKKILKENNMPSAFLYLAMAESNFELKAKSHKSAIGVWQFIPLTAKKYGLKIDYYTDERMDIVKSTNAAVKYLTRLHGLFDKWYLAAIAYNCGEARVIEAITRASLDMYCKDYGNCKNNKTINNYRKVIKDYQHKRVRFSKLYKVYKKVKKLNYTPDIEELLIVQKYLKRQYLPKESRDYIKKIISLAMLNNSEHLLKDENNHVLNIGISTPIVTVQVKGGILLKNVADVMGLKKKDIQELNPHIKKNIVPPTVKSYDVNIPYTYLSRFNNNIHNIKSNVFEMYNVQAGDTLGKIAKKFAIKYTIIKKYNNLKSNMLSINQKLIIPIDPDTYKRPKDYFVKSGDTLEKIARKFDVSLNKIMKDNYLKTSMIHIGDKLVINFR
jgi:membrane-bound lytic murein transglycosylase D